MTSDRIDVAEGVLEWARKSAGMSPELAAKRIGVSQASLQKWESGEKSPTVKQLRKAAEKYKRPLAVLLLPAPPDDFDALRDFRMLSTSQVMDWSPELHAEYRRALTQRDVFLELAEIAPWAVETAQPVKREQFSLEADSSSERAGREVREWLGVELEERWSTGGKALGRWIAAAEGRGVLVIQTSRVAVTEMRGFSISEWPFSVAVLNGSDTDRGRLFTLVHEIAHLLLNSGGLCDLHDRSKSSRSEDRLEQYCNEVSAAALMPESSVLALPEVAEARPSQDWSLEDLSRLSRGFGASSEAFLLRLISLNKSSWAVYQKRKPELEAQYEEARKRQMERRRENQGGPSYYVIKARNLGHHYVNSVIDAFDGRAISSLDVADYLDVRYDQLPKLVEAAG